MSEDTRDWSSPAAEAAPGAEDGAGGPAADEDVASLSFEQALAELERIVQDLERGQLDLDAAIRAYERGTRLKMHCESKLREAQLRVERITLGEDGGARTSPVDVG